jgi:predicted O-methyltransferase YrrM
MISNLVTRAKAKALSLLLPRPYPTRWGSYSFVAETDAVPLPSARLVDLAIQAVEVAKGVSFQSLHARVDSAAAGMLERWPGEHYRLLGALCSVLRPRRVVEIGTASGLSALALLARLPADSRVFSFDIFPWDYKGPETWGGETLLRRDDFEGGRLTHVVGDLSNAATFAQHKDLLRETDLIFVDGPKDGIFEGVLLERLSTIRFATPPILVFDDIRLWNMLRIWNGITQPKLDLTSFGHWSGTGLIDWT